MKKKVIEVLVIWIKNRLIIVMLFSLWKKDNDYKYNHIIKMLLKNPCLLRVVHFGKVNGCLFSKTSLP